MADPTPESRVIDSIRDCLADRLAVEPESIRAGSSLIDDLGADSLDFLDILFSLEKRFGIALRDSGIDRLLRLDFPGAPGAAAGPVPPAALERLEPWLPALRAAPDRASITPAKLLSYITVESLALLIESKLAAAAFPRDASSAAARG